jgi:hypothetical protein
VGGPATANAGIAISAAAADKGEPFALAKPGSKAAEKGIFADAHATARGEVRSQPSPA